MKTLDLENNSLVELTNDEAKEFNGGFAGLIAFAAGFLFGFIFTLGS